MKSITLKFKDGTSLTGFIVGKALSVYIFRVGLLHYIVNRFELLNDPDEKTNELSS